MLNTLETLANKLSSVQQNKGILLDNNGNKLNGLTAVISRSEKTQHQHHYQKESIYHRSSPNSTNNNNNSNKYSDKWVTCTSPHYVHSHLFPNLLNRHLVCARHWHDVPCYFPVDAHKAWITFLLLTLPICFCPGISWYFHLSIVDFDKIKASSANCLYFCSTKIRILWNLTSAIM